MTSDFWGLLSVDFLEDCLADFVDDFADDFAVVVDFDDDELVIDDAVAASVVSSGRSTCNNYEDT